MTGGPRSGGGTASALLTGTGAPSRDTAPLLLVTGLLCPFAESVALTGPARGNEVKAGTGAAGDRAC